MKKFVLIFTLAVVMSAAGIASAYQFEDMIDDWGFWGDAVPITELTGPFTYTHDLNDDVNFAAGHFVTEAWLELDFTNDQTDDVGSRLWGLIKWDYREFARVGFDGANWEYLGEVDNGQYEIVVDIDWINDDGLLDVTLQVWNPLPIGGGLGGNATAWLDHSRLYGSAVPEPGTMLLLGSGVIALLGLGRKKFKK